MAPLPPKPPLNEWIPLFNMEGGGGGGGNLGGVGLALYDFKRDELI